MNAQQLYTKILNAVRKGYISLAGNDSGDYPSSQVTYQGKQNNILMTYPYGLNANAPENTLTIFHKIGHEENLAGLPYCCKERFKNLKKGEVVVGSPQTGSYVKFLENGDIKIYTTGNINVSNVGIGFFGANAQSQQSGGGLIAGSSYTANEQTMLNKVYSALQAYGLLS